MNMTTLYIIIAIVLLIPAVIKEQKIQKVYRDEEKRILSLAEDNAILLKDFKNKFKSIEKQYNQPGVYIFSNLSKNNYKYVGQSINMTNRIKNHLRGNGNPEMYNDIINGDIFAINLVKLNNTNFQNLDSLEKHYITEYNTYYNGYNKTRGNQGGK